MKNLGIVFIALGFFSLLIFGMSSIMDGTIQSGWFHLGTNEIKERIEMSYYTQMNCKKLEFWNGKTRAFQDEGILELIGTDLVK